MNECFGVSTVFFPSVSRVFYDEICFRMISSLSSDFHTTMMNDSIAATFVTTYPVEITVDGRIVPE